MSNPIAFVYQIGGSLPADAPSYIERQCDRDYYELLKAAKYCYVFNCRQMGKSSLRVRVTQKLQAEGIVCATIDPQKIGVEVTYDQWYASAIRSLVGELNLKERFDLRSWLREREKYSPVQRFAEFIETIVLREINTPIVIFVEEIDRLLSLKFGMDDFFGLVRSLFEDRPTKPAYNRLTFSFLGVATPTDLIQSHNVSAFNIGSAVEMTGFTLEEAMPLVQGLTSKIANPQTYLEAAIHWTGGQPFLIQRLLGLIEKELEGITPPEDIAAWVEDLVQQRIVHNWEAQDAPPHLMTIRDRVISVEEKLRGRMLGCYQQVLAGEELEDDRSEERSKLRLTGLVVRREGKLRSYNPIYALVFNDRWVEQQLASLRPAFYAEAFRAWHEVGDEQKNSFLLRGQALEDAEVWAKGKRLSDEDDKFLRESQHFKIQERENILEARQQALNDTERQIQREFLVNEVPHPPGWELAALFKPACQMAGDFYDIFLLPSGGIGLVICDVCDKGIGTSVFTAIFRTLIRAFSSNAILLDSVVITQTQLNDTSTPTIQPKTINLDYVNALRAVRLTNDYVTENHANFNMFATLFFGVLEPATGILTYINGGHEPLVILNAEGVKARLKPTGPAVGMLPNMKFHIQQIGLHPGDILMGYTDGAPEAKSPEGKFFTERRLIELLADPPDSAKALLERIESHLVEHIDSADQFDDITMLAVRRAPQ